MAIQTIYRVRYKLNGSRATNKASLVYAPSDPSAQTIEIGANNHRHAIAILEATILPNDSRSICGRSNIGMFALKS